MSISEKLSKINEFALFINIALEDQAKRKTALEFLTEGGFGSSTVSPRLLADIQCEIDCVKGFLPNIFNKRAELLLSL